mgnify:CR=1 FL=1
MIQSNINKKGKSFRWSGEWKEGQHYFNDEFVQDFCRIDEVVVVCKANHLSKEENKPVILSDAKNNAIGLEKNAYWEIAILPNTDFIVNGDNLPDGVITTEKIADRAVTAEKIGYMAVTTGKINNLAVTKEKLSRELQENLAHKAVVLEYIPGYQPPGFWDNIPKLIQEYKADENKSVFLVYKDGIYFPAELITQSGSEAIVFFQPEGTNLRKYILRATGREEVLIYGDTVRYNKQSLTDSQKQQARENIEAMPDITIDLDAIEGVWDDTFGPTDFAYPYNDLDDSKYDTKRKVVMDYISNKLTEMGLLYTEGENSQFFCMPYGHTLHFRLTTKIDEGLLSFYADNVMRFSSTDIAQWGLRFSNPYSGLFIERDPVKGFDYGAFLAGTGFGLSTPSAESTDIAIWCSGEAEFVRNNVMSALQACRPLCLAVAEDIYTDEEKEKGREILNTIDKAAFLTDAEVNDIWDNN